MTDYQKIYSDFVKYMWERYPEYDVTSLLPQLIVVGVITTNEKTLIQNKNMPMDKIIVKCFS